MKTVRYIIIRLIGFTPKNYIDIRSILSKVGISQRITAEAVSDNKPLIRTDIYIQLPQRRSDKVVHTMDPPDRYNINRLTRWYFTTPSKTVQSYSRTPAMP